MAERKPASSRKPAKRGPTKAAALKALGLTQEDLDALKELRAQQVQAAEPCNCGLNETCSNCPEKRTGNEVTASANLTDNNLFLKATEDPQAYLEDRPAPEQQTAPLPAAEPVWYMRNLRGVDVSFRLTRQEKQGEKRTQLKPRGQRGDMQRLQSDDLRDPALQTQVNFGLVEVIPEGEAVEAIRKQGVNAQNQVPAHIAMLRNPLGQEYNQGPRTLSHEEANGYKVADLDPGLMQGKLSDREIQRGGGFAQNAQQTPTGGNPSIISDGFMAPAQSDGSTADNERARQIDELARSNQFEGPGAGLGEVTVRVAPVQRYGE